MQLFIDCETTGLDPQWNELYELCIGSAGFGYSVFKFRPSGVANIDLKALEINGMTVEELMDLPERKPAIQIFKDWLYEYRTDFGKITPIGHNYHFDCNFITQLIGSILYNTHFHYHYKDTMIAAQFLDDSRIYKYNLTTEDKYFKSYSLSCLCEKLETVNRPTHGALNDVKATEELYYKLLGVDK